MKHILEVLSRANGCKTEGRGVIADFIWLIYSTIGSRLSCPCCAFWRGLMIGFGVTGGLWLLTKV